MLLNFILAKIAISRRQTQIYLHFVEAKCSVSKIVKGAMVVLATEFPELICVEEARRFSAKSMRCGGTSAAAAEAVRDGVLQGHGGWLARTSLVHYDQMMESEKATVSATLNAAVAKASMGEPKG
ncbi:MAG: hypothetical protein QMB43_04070, partial [Alistipes putredinis]